MFSKRLNENGPELSVVNLGPGSGLRGKRDVQKGHSPRSVSHLYSRDGLPLGELSGAAACGKNELQGQKSFHVTNLLYSAAKSVKLQAPVDVNRP
jgi:hypothetical protein